MDKRVLRERMRKKRRQAMIRKYTKLATYVVAAVLVVVFVIKGVILPIANRVGGESKSGEVVEVQAQPAEADPDAAVRQPVKGEGDVGKVTSKAPGWHEDESGRWYQNADGTYYAGGFQEIDGVDYSFDENGHMQTGWVSKGVRDYFFNDDGSYNPEKRRPMLALTFDDGPGEFTDKLLDCLEENNAHATFFMQGINVGNYPDAVKRMLELGCEVGSHSWNHPQLTNFDMDYVAKQFTDTDNALIAACGQAATVARAPYGAYSQEVIDTVGKPFFMWSLDSMDWSLLDVEADYNSVMTGDLTDGSIILMHDIHEPSFKAALRIIPDLVAQGYKLVTVSELAEAKGVTLQNASYSEFWDSSLAAGIVAGYEGNGTTDSGSGDEGSDGEEQDMSDGSEDDGSGDYTDGSEDDGSGGYTDGSEDDGSGDYTDGSEDDGSGDYTDGSEDDGSGDYTDGE